MTTLTAQVSEVKLGTISVPGYLTNTGVYGFSLADIATTFLGWDKRRGSDIFKQKGVKSLATKGFKGSEIVLIPETKNTISFIEETWLTPILLKFAIAGNEPAEAWIDTLASLSVSQLLRDAFGKKFEIEERQNFLEKRERVKNTHIEFQGYFFKSLTDSGLSAKRAEHKISCLVNDIYRSAFHGKDASQLRVDRKLASDKNLRDNLEPDDLALIDSYERIAINQLVNHGKSPDAAISFAIESLDDGYLKRLMEEIADEIVGYSS